MQTTDADYKKHLEGKYLPGRDLYLRWFFYPKILRQLGAGKIVDLGCGTGEFLRFMREKSLEFSGIDNNFYLVEQCRKEGFEVAFDDVTKLSSINEPIKNAIIDNVLEHLELSQIDSFFSVAKDKFEANGILLVIVPDKRGYKYDPTHKTFVNKDVIESMCKIHQFRLEKSFYHPLNFEPIGHYLYLNMQVFKVVRI